MENADIVSGRDASWFISDLVGRTASPDWGIAGVHRDVRRSENARFCVAETVAAEGISAAIIV